MRSVLMYAVSCVLLAACGGTSADRDSPPTSSPTSSPASSSEAPATFTVTGFVTAEGSFGLACKGVGSSADLHKGTQVVVLGAGRAKLATGALGDGFADDDQPQRRCIFSFSVRKVPDGKGPFSVQVAHRPPVSFDRRRAGQVEVRLGQP